MNLKQFTVSMLGQEVKFLSILGINEETGIVVGYMEPVPGNDHLSFLGVIIAFPDNRGYTLSEIGECTILLDLPSSVSFFTRAGKQLNNNKEMKELLTVEQVKKMHFSQFDEIDWYISHDKFKMNAIRRCLKENEKCYLGNLLETAKRYFLRQCERFSKTWN